MGLLQWLGFRAPAPEPVEPPTPAHALDALCVRFAATYDRSIMPDGQVQVRLVRPDATLAAVGPTTRVAVAALMAKAVAWESLL
jgi:hypothetical protein